MPKRMRNTAQAVDKTMDDAIAAWEREVHFKYRSLADDLVFDRMAEWRVHPEAPDCWVLVSAGNDVMVTVHWFPGVGVWDHEESDDFDRQAFNEEG